MDDLDQDSESQNYSAKSPIKQNDSHGLGFDDVNDFVYGADVHFEDLQNLCIGLAAKLEGTRDTESDVINDICQRQVKGMAKYGTTVAENPLPLRQWLQHAYEECLDQAIYLKRAIQNLDE